VTAGRVTTRSDAAVLAAQWRASGARVVLASGCFDLLSAGHTRFLREARSRGDRLIVVVLGDRSATSLGAGRPVLPARERGRIVAALRGVGAVIVAEGEELPSIESELKPVEHSPAPAGAEAAAFANVIAALGRSE